MRNQNIPATCAFLLIVFLLNNSFSQTDQLNNCVMKDIGSSRYVVDSEGRSWDCRFLTYYFVNGTNDIPNDDEQVAFRNAFSKWSSVTNLDFLETCTELDADIRILWATGDHGDPCDPESNCYFDGPYVKPIAHAWFPPIHLNAEYSGDMHFDDELDWSMDASGYNMETVALHEIGHALGLDHSLVQDAVMMEGYDGDIEITLMNDDIQGIRSIYGARTNPINGEYVTCAESTVFSVCDNSHSEFIWIVPGDLTITNGQGTNQITVTNSSGNCGHGDIYARILTDCDLLTFSKNISYCCEAPHAPFDIYIVPDLVNCCYSFRVIPWNACYDSFHWSINSQEYFSNSWILDQCFDEDITKYFSVSVSAINPCGESSIYFEYIIAQPIPSLQCQSRSNILVELYPNPVSTLLNIKIYDDNSNQESFELSIFNSTGQKILSKIVAGGLNSLDTSTLKNGQYFVYIENSYIREVERFVICNNQKMVPLFK